MNNLCPFFKEKCHGNQCKMWKNEECLIVNFLEGLQESNSEETAISAEEDIETRSPHLYREAEAVPKWLKVATPETIAKEMLEFKDDEFSEYEQVQFYMIPKLFWNKKGVNRLFLPMDIQSKIQQANMKAEIQFKKEEKDRKKALLAKEKEELPSLVCQLADWARLSGLKRVTYSDIDAFLLEKDKEILKETKKPLQSMTNFNLKTGK